MIVDAQALHRIMPAIKWAKAIEFAPFLSGACDRFNIVGPKRVSAFLAQIAHESGQLRYMEEIASGQDYEGRKDLGNTQPGDGRRFKGRGPIQITGRTNYQRCGQALQLDLESQPEILAQPMHGCYGSAWFWADRGLNTLADEDKFGQITKLINGGYTGLDDRIKYWLVARKVAGI